MDYLAHYGILGMKWGIRRYQNKDGTLTEAGKKRYGTEENYKRKSLSDMIEKRSVRYISKNSDVKKAAKDLQNLVSIERKANEAYNRAEDAFYDNDNEKSSDKLWDEYMLAEKKLDEAQYKLYDKCEEFSKLLLGKYGNNIVTAMDVNGEKYETRSYQKLTRIIEDAGYNEFYRDRKNRRYKKYRS